jgi:hypothetical protein
MPETYRAWLIPANRRAPEIMSAWWTESDVRRVTQCHYDDSATPPSPSGRGTLLAEGRGQMRCSWRRTGSPVEPIKPA